MHLVESLNLETVSIHANSMIMESTFVRLFNLKPIYLFLDGFFLPCFYFAVIARAVYQVKVNCCEMSSRDEVLKLEKVILRIKFLKATSRKWNLEACRMKLSA